MPGRESGGFLSANAIRDALRHTVLKSYSGSVASIAEFWVPESHERADLVIVGDRLRGYEIKSSRDTLKRLPRQASAFSRLFDYCTAVVAERHVEGVLAVLPSWWGVVCVTSQCDGPAFNDIRSAEVNLQVDASALVRVLWSREARAALTSMGYAPPERATRASMWRSLLDLADEQDLKEIVRRSVLGRQRITTLNAPL
jgi:hypothetical protein